MEGSTLKFSPYLKIGGSGGLCHFELGEVYEVIKS